MRASFVLVNYNRKQEVLETISKTKELIANNFRDFEIVIVDNASTDGSAEAIKAKHQEGVILIENPVNTGAPAWNLGFAKAQGDYFVIIDDDSHVVSGLEKALAHLDKNPDIGVLALNVLTGPYTSKLWGWKDRQDIVGFIGCGAIYRKAVYDKIGGYADWIFLYANEWDLGIRCIDAGYRVQYFADCKVDHRTSPLHRTNKRLRVLCTKHELAIIYKHFSRKRWKYVLRLGMNNLKAMKNGDFKGAYYNIIGFNEFLKFRKSLPYTPVSVETQNVYLHNFAGTHFFFGFLRGVKGRILNKVKPVLPNKRSY